MNILLIGMPGCGKTTVGRLLSEKCGFDFLDLDEKIEKRSGQKISEIFASEGEDGFRRTETAVLKDALQKENTVISTGGGIVTVKENRVLLKEYKSVVFLDRPLEKILSDVDVSSRPLLAQGKEKLRTLFDERYELYRLAAAIRIENDSDAETAAERIIKALNL